MRYFYKRSACLGWQHNVIHQQSSYTLIVHGDWRGVRLRGIWDWRLEYILWNLWKPNNLLYIIWPTDLKIFILTFASIAHHTVLTEHTSYSFSVTAALHLTLSLSATFDVIIISILLLSSVLFFAFIVRFFFACVCVPLYWRTLVYATLKWFVD